MKSFTSLSIFQNFKDSDLYLEPSPHIVIKNCLEDSLYNNLKNCFPTEEEYKKILKDSSYNFDKQNCRIDIPTSIVLKNPKSFSKIWLDFINYHTSEIFLKELEKIIGSQIKKLYPNLKTKIGGLSEIKSGIRDPKDNLKYDLDLDCQIAINTPSRIKSQVIKAHTDNIKELYAGLLYFKNSKDMSKGGDLIIYRWKDPKKKFYTKGVFVDDTAIEEVKRIPYGENTLIFFINSEDFIHSVSPRMPSPYRRRFINILGDISSEKMPNGLFNQPLKWSKYKMKLEIKKLLIKFGLLVLLKKIYKLF